MINNQRKILLLKIENRGIFTLETCVNRYLKNIGTKGVYALILIPSTLISIPLKLSNVLPGGLYANLCLVAKY